MKEQTPFPVFILFGDIYEGTAKKLGPGEYELPMGDVAIRHDDMKFDDFLKSLGRAFLVLKTGIPALPKMKVYKKKSTVKRN